MNAIAFQTCGLVFAATLVAAALCDLRSRTIPNLLPAILTAVFIPAAWFAGMNVSQAAWHLAAAVVVFGAAAVLFALRAWGGGDAKLVAAVALWLGFAALPRFVAIMALAGGVLAVLALLLQGRRAKVPYGVAIALAGLDWAAAVLLSRGVS